MNYLVHQGYPSAAVSFAREANLALSKESVDSITARMEIRNKIHAGDIEGAIHHVNTLNPQVSLPPYTCAGIPLYKLCVFVIASASPCLALGIAYGSYWTTTP